MVEGVLIDKVVYFNDIIGVMFEMFGFEIVFDNVINYVKIYKDIFVVVIVDYLIGGLLIVKGKDYKWNLEVIYKMKYFGMYMIK